MKPRMSGRGYKVKIANFFLSVCVQFYPIILYFALYDRSLSKVHSLHDETTVFLPNRFSRQLICFCTTKCVWILYSSFPISTQSVQSVVIWKKKKRINSSQRTIIVCYFNWILSTWDINVIINVILLVYTAIYQFVRKISDANFCFECIFVEILINY